MTPAKAGHAAVDVDGQTVVALFATTIFTGSSLLFLVQPMFAKLVLPRLGGSPSVWTTCVLFFQGVLLVGYVYAHVSTRWLGVRRQVVLHLVVMMLPLAFLPLTAGSRNPGNSDNPVFWLLGTMGMTVGIPFFIVSTSAPLLQRWFATFPLPRARDPYFLYSASNLGSMIALLAYPFVLEPLMGVQRHTLLWSVGYVLLVLLTAACAWTVRRWSLPQPDVADTAAAAAPEPVSLRQRLYWVAQSFVPSSLMLGVTLHVSSDIAAVPLMWVLPLAMYLLTFVLAFSAREVISQRFLTRALPPLVFACLVTVLLGVNGLWAIPLHLVTFFCAALLCHRELASRRPGVSHLTEFYIWMSLGGVLGGIFNTIVAPKLFATILEYPLMLAAAALLRPAPRRGGNPEPLVVIVTIAVIVLACGGYLILGVPSPQTTGRLLGAMIGLTLPIVFARRARAFGTVALAFVAVIALGRPAFAGKVLFVGRSFFGVHKVLESTDRTYRILQHGSTVHGQQQLNAGPCEPTSYYSSTSPIGQLFDARRNRLDRVGIIGLGSGALACYAKAGESWTFYEIDAMVERIARNPVFFTQLGNSKGDIAVMLGDGRITLQTAQPAEYDVLIVDAFSSDAIPVHLLTREALHLYLSRLAARGVIAMHISNRYFNLEPMLGALVEQERLYALANIDAHLPLSSLQRGGRASHWVMVARDARSLASLEGRPGWRRPAVSQEVKPWTDDYSTILSVLRDFRR